MTGERNSRAKRLDAAKSETLNRMERAKKTAEQKHITLLEQPFADEYRLNATSDELGEHAIAALTLFAKEKMLAKAFSDFQLSPENPYHWKMLILRLAEVVYHTRGAKVRWTKAERVQLAQRFQELIDNDPKGPKKAVDRAAARLCETHYQGSLPGALKRQYQITKNAK